MSLINDALKRARDSQPHAQPPSPVPPLEPAAEAPASGGSGAKFFLYLLILCVAVGNLLLFVYASRRDADGAAGGGVAAPAATGAAPTPVVETVLPVPAAAPPAQVAAETPLPATHGPLPPASETGAPVSPAATETAAANPGLPRAETPPSPAPAPLRLQSLILGGARSSVMISGRVLFLGDRIQGFRVTAIDAESVTLEGNGQTNVLTLP